MNISPARAAAFDVLLRIENERSFSSALLPLYEESLSAADSGLCHELTLGSLRRQIYLDRVIAEFAGSKKLDPAVRVAIRIGLYQLLFLERVPDYSAINESVGLVQRAKKTSAKGFVNAILRRATREKPVFQYADETERISVETSHPQWLIEKWAGEFGAGEAELLAAANNEIPQPAFRLTQFVEDIEPDAKSNWRQSEFVEGCFLTDKSSTQLRELEENGAIYFQDEASQMAARAVEIPNGGVFLDVCAAPGGKTGLIAQRFAGDIRLAAAGDLHWSRVEYLRDNCARQEVDFVNIVQYDATAPLPFADEAFDVVFVDAPCSGTGTIRHNPEIRYFLTVNDFPALSSKQRSILQNASKLVKHGGSLVYSTCSLEKEENEEIAREFLTNGSDFESTLPKVQERFLTADGFARTWPHRDGMDGFFIAEFRRN